MPYKREIDPAFRNRNKRATEHESIVRFLYNYNFVYCCVQRLTYSNDRIYEGGRPLLWLMVVCNITDDLMTFFNTRHCPQKDAMFKRQYPCTRINTSIDQVFEVLSCSSKLEDKMNFYPSLEECMDGMKKAVKHLNLGFEDGSVFHMIVMSNCLYTLEYYLLNCLEYEYFDIDDALYSKNVYGLTVFQTLQNRLEYSIMLCYLRGLDKRNPVTIDDLKRNYKFNLQFMDFITCVETTENNLRLFDMYFPDPNDPADDYERRLISRDAKIQSFYDKFKENKRIIFSCEDNEYIRTQFRTKTFDFEIMYLMVQRKHYKSLAIHLYGLYPFRATRSIHWLKNKLLSKSSELCREHRNLGIGFSPLPPTTSLELANIDNLIRKILYYRLKDKILIDVTPEYITKCVRKVKGIKAVVISKICDDTDNAFYPMQFHLDSISLGDSSDDE